MRREEGSAEEVDGDRRRKWDIPGIVIVDRNDGEELRPRVAAFIWGGKVKPTPVLPFGRKKGAA